jgi:hypothetical protein
VICSADLAAIVDAANAALPEGERCRAIVATRYVDTMPGGAIAEADAPPPAMDAWLRSDPALPAGCTRWTDALAHACNRARMWRRRTTSRSCPTRRARPGSPRDACTPIAR